MLWCCKPYWSGSGRTGPDGSQTLVCPPVRASRRDRVASHPPFSLCLVPGIGTPQLAYHVLGIVLPASPWLGVAPTLATPVSKLLPLSLHLHVPASPSEWARFPALRRLVTDGETAGLRVVWVAVCLAGQSVGVVRSLLLVGWLRPIGRARCQYYHILVQDTTPYQSVYDGGERWHGMW